jgi:ArsR family transcriptional regulator
MDRNGYIRQGVYMADRLRQLEDVFKALADSTRLRILRLLMAGDVCVCDIHETLKIPQAKASRHLAYLRRAGLVTTRRDGLWVHYSLAKSVDPIIATIADATTHVLGHVDALKKDAERLEKRTGCCVPAAASIGRPCCLSPRNADVPLRSARAQE